MIEKYITPKENMILAITRASQGDDTARVLELARKYDPEEKRTLRILTKYELFGSPGHAQAVSVQFALSESRNQPHAVACRIKGNGYDADEEMNEICRHGLDARFCGTNNLKDRLIPILRQSIK